MSTASSTPRGLLAWYDANKRPLPWRNSTDPYAIWLSEVILQQTRVDQGTAYWHRFMERYPSVLELAAAPEDEVLKLWQGLGYYSRARNLLMAARSVAQEHGGRFPADLAALKALKGVGDYTAAAIGSIAFGLMTPVVDGNVYRLLARYFDVATPIDSTAGKREFLELATRLLAKDRPGDHNQAMMELGAMVCTPKQPDCPACPLATDCLARKRGTIAERPVKVGKTAVRERHFNYLHLEAPGHLYLRKREGPGIWQGLHEPPVVETDRAAGKATLLRLLNEQLPGGWKVLGRSERITHVLSHQRIKAVFWQVRVEPGWTPPKDWLIVPLDRVEVYAVPRLIERWLLGDVPYGKA
jgi:A/G-specific adenine glycosylase